MNNILNWGNTIWLLLVAIGILPFLYKQIELTQQKLATGKITKKTEALNFALNLAKGAVGIAEKLSGNGEAQATSAVIALKQRLQENHMEDLFTETQMRQIIQQAYGVMKVDGRIDALKVASIEEPEPLKVEEPEEAKVNPEDAVVAPQVEATTLSTDAPQV